MRVSGARCAGRADPFGLLVIVVLLALLVTVAIQAQASSGSGPLVSHRASPPMSIDAPSCLTTSAGCDTRR